MSKPTSAYLTTIEPAPITVQRSNSWKFLRRAAKKLLLPSPVAARHAEHSMLFSMDGAPSGPNDRIFDLSLEAIALARRQDLSSIKARLGGRFRFPDELVELWPGEHYKLLASIVESLRPRLVIEVGTAEGMSALALKTNLPSNGKVITFDLIHWKNYPNSCLGPEDFIDGRLEQMVADLGDEAIVARHRTVLERADLIFIDAAKDGFLEQRLIHNFGTLTYSSPPIVIFDDIRLWNMLDVWYELRWPKLDLTSFGHWSGTGVCQLVGEGLGVAWSA